eukprot:1190005-Prorocentrum_minimum.AAC.6
MFPAFQRGIVGSGLWGVVSLVPMLDGMTRKTEKESKASTGERGHVERPLVVQVAAGLDYTVVRPGGLSNDPPSGAGIIAGGADSFFGNDSDPGREISRDSVAEVSIEALFQPAADKKIVEILGANAKATPKAKWFDFPEAPAKGCAVPV